MSGITDEYTIEEIVAFYKAANLALNTATSQSRLDTGQSEQEFRTNVQALKEQRDYWVQMYNAKSGGSGPNIVLTPEPLF